MKVLRYIVNDQGIVLIVEARPAEDERAQVREQFDQWAGVAGGYRFPVLILQGDADTKVDDLRSQP